MAKVKVRLIKSATVRGVLREPGGDPVSVSPAKGRWMVEVRKVAEYVDAAPPKTEPRKRKPAAPAPTSGAEGNADG